MNRRDFVVYSASAAAGIGVAAFAVSPVSKSAPIRGVSGALPYKIIFDARFRASRAFGAHAAKLGFALRPISGDVTALWFHELQPLWAKRNAAIVGMTTSASLLCLEQLAWEQWMRVVARIEHQPQSDGTLRHRLFLHADSMQSARAALAENVHWAERMVAPLVTRLATEQCGRPEESVVLTHDPSRGDPEDSLVSWVIAARSIGGAPSRLVRPHSIEVTPI